MTAGLAATPLRAPTAPLHAHLAELRKYRLPSLDDAPTGFRTSAALIGFLFDEAGRRGRVGKDGFRFEYLTALRHGWIRQLEEIGAMKKVAPEDVEAEVAHVREHGQFAEEGVPA